MLFIKGKRDKLIKSINFNGTASIPTTGAKLNPVVLPSTTGKVKPLKPGRLILKLMNQIANVKKKFRTDEVLMKIMGEDVLWKSIKKGAAPIKAVP